MIMQYVKVSLTLALGQVIRHSVLTCLGASQVKGFNASRVTIQGDIVVPRENVEDINQ
jgi:hypothetical protein